MTLGNMREQGGGNEALPALLKINTVKKLRVR
jgi:hypothetical protein